MNKTVLFLFLFLMLSVTTIVAQDKAKDAAVKQSITKDGGIHYPKKLLVNPDFDFKLKKVEKGIFAVSFYNDSDKAITIKIYDIIGNLVKQETISEKGSITKEYDLSYYNPRFFIVEAGSSQYNKTKSIIVE